MAENLKNKILKLDLPVIFIFICSKKNFLAVLQDTNVSGVYVCIVGYRFQVSM